MALLQCLPGCSYWRVLLCVLMLCVRERMCSSYWVSMSMMNDYICICMHACQKCARMRVLICACMKIYMISHHVVVVYRQASAGHDSHHVAVVYFVCLLSMSVCGSVPTLLYRLPSDPAPWFEQDESHKFPYGCKQLQPHTFNEDFGPVSACPDQPTIRVDPYASPL